MSEFRFNCQACGQHLSGDERYAGLQIVCPTCGKAVVVPAAPAPARPAAVPSLPPTPSAPPLPGPRPGQAPRTPQKTSGLAIASLVCSIGSFLIIPFGFIPGIICGHMARKRISTTPGLQGAGLAKAGLIIGYVALAVNVIAVAVLIMFFAAFAGHVHQAMTLTPSQHPGMKVHPRSAAPAEKETTDTGPDGSGWTLKLAGVEIPSAPVTGRIHGQPFKMEKATLEGGWLKFVEGKDFFADREMDVVVFENDATKLSGRTFTVPKEEFGSNPHIYVHWKEAGGDAPKQRSFMDRYALRLEFGQWSAGKLTGKIYLCVPDKEKSFIAGTFEVPSNGKK